VSGADLLVRAGERKRVGGQEDMLIGIALELAAEKAQSDKAEAGRESVNAGMPHAAR
jgi:DmpG-like communication domain